MSEVIVVDDELTVREMGEDDVALVSRWLSDPQVLSYYEGRDRPQDADAVRALLTDAELTPCIVELAGVPIGYLQIADLEQAWKTENGYRADERVLGIDQFIGVPELWGRGLGTRFVRATARHLVEHGGADRVVTDPQAWNARAVRAYEKAGFRRVRLLPEHEMHEGELHDCWLMEFEETS